MPENLNSEWKETGKNIGQAFVGLGKTIKGEVSNDPANDPTKEDWKDTGKDIGNAFKGLGKTLLKTAKKGVEKADNLVNSDKPEESSNENLPE